MDQCAYFNSPACVGECAVCPCWVPDPGLPKEPKFFVVAVSADDDMPFVLTTTNSLAEAQRLAPAGARICFDEEDVASVMARLEDRAKRIKHVEDKARLARRRPGDDEDRRVVR